MDITSSQQTSRASHAQAVAGLALVAAIPPALEDAALVDASTAGAVGGASEAMWLKMVRRHEAPQAAVRKPRFTRWRLLEVRQFWLDFVANGGDGSRSRAIAATASAAAQQAAARQRGE